MFITESTCCLLPFVVDGSSLFGENNRYATFPAFSVGWRIKDELLLWKILTFCPILNYVLAGEQTEVCKVFREDILPLRLQQIIFGTSYPIQGNESGPLYSGYSRTWLGNPDLKWETTTQTDLAVDFGFFNQRLTVL